MKIINVLIICLVSVTAVSLQEAGAVEFRKGAPVRTRTLFQHDFE